MAPVMLNTRERAWDPITLDVYPEGSTRFTMYRDDGETMEFETQGRFTETELTSEEHADRSVTLTIAESNKLFTPRTYEATVHLELVPTRVSAHGRALSRAESAEAYQGAAEGWIWDDARRVLSLKLDARSTTTHAIDIAVDGTVLAPLEPTVVEDDGAGAVPVPTPSPARQLPYFFPPPSLPPADGSRRWCSLGTARGSRARRSYWMAGS